MNVGSLFSGGGLFDGGLASTGLEHRWLCEVDPFRRELLGRRWPGAHVFDDVRAVGVDTAERVDVIAGGVPCKGASTVGKRTGLDHPETRLWREMERAIGELRPSYVVVENVANLLAVKDGAVWGTILGDLDSLRYVVQWDCIPAAAFGAPHLRDRLVAIAADADGPGQQWLADVEGEENRWPNAGGSDRAFTADAASSNGQRAWPEREALGRTAGGGHATPADANSNGVREQPEPEPGRGRAAVAGGSRASASDAEGERWAETASGEQRGRVRPEPRAGVAVEWGAYAPAIRRWEGIHGPAPEPLIRRMDDRRAARVDRSRLSALGDGVQWQLGLMVGEFLMEQER